MSVVDMERLRALLEVAADPSQAIPPSWWSSFGRECAQVLPIILADHDVLAAALAELRDKARAYREVAEVPAGNLDTVQDVARADLDAAIADTAAAAEARLLRRWDGDLPGLPRRHPVLRRSPMTTDARRLPVTCGECDLFGRTEAFDGCGPCLNEKAAFSFADGPRPPATMGDSAPPTWCPWREESERA